MNSKHNTQPSTQEAAPVKIIPENFTPSAELQRLESKFKARKQAYLDTQAAYGECDQETQRLEQTAQALETEAEQANATWKELAMMHGADQRKINAEVERGVKLKMDAEKFRRTVQVREELRFELVMQMKQARDEAASAGWAVRSHAIKENIDALLATEGLGELVGELRALVRLAEQEQVTALQGETLGSLLASTAVAPVGAPRAEQISFYLPRAVVGELPQGITGMQLQAFKLSKGATTRITEARALAHAE